MLSELEGKGQFVNQLVHHHDFSCGGFTVDELGNGGHTEYDHSGVKLPDGQRVIHFDENAPRHKEGNRFRTRYDNRTWEVIAIANLGIQEHRWAGKSTNLNGFGYLIKPV